MSANIVSLDDLPAPPQAEASKSAKELTVNDLPSPPAKKPGGVKQWAKAIGLGAVPAFVESFAQGPNAPKVQLPGSKTELPFAGPSEAMGQFKLAPSEQERYKKANEATDFALKNPGIAASAAWAGIKAEYKTLATDLASGPGDTEEQAIQIGRAHV